MVNFDTSKPFKIRRERAGERPRVSRVQETGGEQEELTRVVQGQKASDIEERYYKAAEENIEIDAIVFQPSYGPGWSLPGEIRPDFLLVTGFATYPVFVDGSYWHRSPEQRERDQMQVGQLNMMLQGTGAYPAQRVPGEDIEDMDMARAAVAKTLQGGYLEY